MSVLRWVALAVAMASPVAAEAGTVRVAVAANFADAARALETAFESGTGHAVDISFGATGGLFAQISQGAPFDVFLAAETERPAKAVAEGLAVAGSQFTYAIGALVLWSATEALPDGAETLRRGAFEKLAIADPATAPYGRAAIETLRALGVHDAIMPKLVTGESVAQAFQFAATGNAELGFVALSQTLNQPGNAWRVPAELYAPIKQDAVLLSTAEQNEAARAYLDFLRSEAGQRIVASYGYETAAP